MPFLNYFFHHLLSLCFLDFSVENSCYSDVDSPRTGFSRSSPDQLHLHHLRTWKRAFSGGTPDLNQKLYGRGPATCVLISPPGDSGASKVIESLFQADPLIFFVVAVPTFCLFFFVFSSVFEELPQHYLPILPLLFPSLPSGIPGFNF